MNNSNFAKRISEKGNLYFVLFAFLYSWVIYLIIYLFQWDSTHVESRLCLIAAFGPSLSAFFLSRLLDKRTVSVSRKKFATLSILIFLFAGSIEWLDHFVWDHKITSQLILVDIIIIGLVTFILTRIASDYEKVRQLFKKIMQFKIGLGWIVLSIILWPSLVYISNFLARWMGYTVAEPSSYEPMKLIFLVIESFIWYLIFGAPLAEEPGWRGFWLNNLQKNMSPLKASIIIGFFWGLWHLPLHLMGYYPYGALGAVIRIFEIPAAIMFTWLFNHSKGSLVPVLFLHTARNTTSLFLPRHFIISSLLVTLLAIVLIINDRMWKKRNIPIDIR